MDETRLLQLLAKKMAGEITGDETKELELMLAQNPDAVYNLELLSHLWQQKQRTWYLEDSFQRHREKFSAEFNTPAADPFIIDPPARSRSWVKGLLVASVVVAAVLCSVWLFNSGSSSPVAVLSVPKQVVSKKGNKQHILLPDGSSVWLNADSRISYDSNMNNHEFRTVYLTGEAYFDVIKKDQPFIINTNKISVKVLGTAFNIKAYPDDTVTEATLVRGRIELSVNSKPERKIILNPSEKFALFDSTANKDVTENFDKDPVPTSRQKMVVNSIQPITLANKEYVEEASWVEDVMVFKNETLEDLMPKLERRYDVHIKVDNAKILGYHYTGVFKTETVKDALNAMQLIRPFNYTIDKNSITIY